MSRLSPDCVRKVANWTMYKPSETFDSDVFNKDHTLKDLAIKSPKMYELMKTIRRLDEEDIYNHNKLFKHFIFSDVKSGIKNIASVFLAYDYSLIFDQLHLLKSSPELLSSRSNNFAILIMNTMFKKPLSKRTRREILELFNRRPDNIHGDLCRFMILGSEFKEGIDLYDCKYVHILEPQITKSDMRQIMGRGTRFCGNKGLNFHPSKGWPLHVMLYDIKVPIEIEENYGVETMHELFLKVKKINVQRMGFTDELEFVSIEGSVDYELNKNIHLFNQEQYEGTGGSENIICGADCKSRSTTKNPITTSFMICVYFALNHDIPNIRKMRQRDFFCEQVKLDPVYCKELQKAWENPGQYIILHAREILNAIMNKKHYKMRSGHRNSFLKLASKYIPEIVKINALLEVQTPKLQIKSPEQLSLSQSPKQLPQSNKVQSQVKSQVQTKQSQSQSQVKSQVNTKVQTPKQSHEDSQVQSPKQSHEDSQVQSPLKSRLQSPKQSHEDIQVQSPLKSRLQSPLQMSVQSQVNSQSPQRSPQQSPQMSIQSPLKSRLQSPKQAHEDSQVQSPIKSRLQSPLQMSVQSQVNSQSPQRSPQRSPQMSIQSHEDSQVQSPVTPKQSQVNSKVQSQIKSKLQSPQQSVQSQVNSQSPQRSPQQSPQMSIQSPLKSRLKTPKQPQVNSKVQSHIKLQSPQQSVQSHVNSQYPQRSVNSQVNSQYPQASSIKSRSQSPEQSPEWHVPSQVQAQVQAKSPFPPLHKNASFMEVREYVGKYFSEFTWPAFKLENMCIDKGGSSIATLTFTQDFIRNFFTASSPQKGMLLWHSMGVGKTCAAIATASSSFEAMGYTILWVTRSSLKNDMWKNVFDTVCHDGLSKKMTKGWDMPSNVMSRTKLLSESWSIKPMSYRQFTNLILQKNTFYTQLRDKNGGEDPLRKTLIVIDEAHKLYGGNDLHISEKPNMSKFHEVVMKSYKKSGINSVRLLLMTGTPIVNEPMEFIQLINLLKEEHEQLPAVFDDFSRKYLDEVTTHFSDRGKVAYLNAIAGHVSYLNRERDARQFSQPVITNINIDMSKGNYSPPPLGTSNSIKEKIENRDEIDKDIKELLSSKKMSLKEINNECKYLEGSELEECTLSLSEKIERANKFYDDTMNTKIQDRIDLVNEIKRIRHSLSKKSAKYDESQYHHLMTTCAEDKKKTHNTINNDESVEFNAFLKP